MTPSTRKFLGNMFAGAFGFGIPTLTILVCVPILIHHVGAIEFGIVQLGQAVGSGAGFIDLGFTNATVFFVARHYSQHDHSAIGRVMGTSLLSLVGIIALVGLTLFFSAPYLPDLFRVPSGDMADAVTVFRLAALQMLFAPVILVLNAYFKGVHRFAVSSAMLCVMSTVTWAAAALLGFLMPLTMVVIAWVFFAGTGVTALATAIIFLTDEEVRRIPRGAFRPLLSKFREMWQYSSAVFAQGILILLNNQFQRLLVGAVLGPAAVTIYFAALQLTTKIHTGLAATFEAFFPYSVSNQSNVRAMYRRVQVGSLLAGATILVPLAIFAEFICRLWLGSKIAGAVAPLVPELCLATLFMTASIPAYYAVNAAQKPWLNFVFMGVTVVVTAAFLLLSLPALDIKAFIDAYTLAAIAATIAMVGYVEIFLLRRNPQAAP
jgi:O-antigen/teichoic acid export membrane protein